MEVSAAGDGRGQAGARSECAERAGLSQLGSGRCEGPAARGRTAEGGPGARRETGRADGKVRGSALRGEAVGSTPLSAARSILSDEGAGGGSTSRRQLHTTSPPRPSRQQPVLGCRIDVVTAGSRTAAAGSRSRLARDAQAGWLLAAAALPFGGKSLVAGLFHRRPLLSPSSTLRRRQHTTADRPRQTSPTHPPSTATG